MNRTQNHKGNQVINLMKELTINRQLLNRSKEVKNHRSRWNNESQWTTVSRSNARYQAQISYMNHHKQEYVIIAYNQKSLNVKKWTIKHEKLPIFGHLHGPEIPYNQKTITIFKHGDVYWDTSTYKISDSSKLRRPEA